MKLLAILLTIMLVGCATNRSMSYTQLEQVKVTNADCGNMDRIIDNMEAQLRARGFANVEPEQLNDADRKYNATARVVIWSLRIGCNNLGRYKS